MASQTLYVLGGAAIVGMGVANLLSADFARKLFYRHAAGSWGPSRSEAFERMGVRLIRFVLGPALIVAGSMLLMKGL